MESGGFGDWKASQQVNTKYVEMAIIMNHIYSIILFSGKFLFELFLKS